MYRRQKSLTRAQVLTRTSLSRFSRRSLKSEKSSPNAMLRRLLKSEKSLPSAMQKNKRRHRTRRRQLIKQQLLLCSHRLPRLRVMRRWTVTRQVKLQLRRLRFLWRSDKLSPSHSLSRQLSKALLNLQRCPKEGHQHHRLSSQKRIYLKRLTLKSQKLSSKFKPLNKQRKLPKS